MSALLDLAERCEAATGPDRELDDAILLAIREGATLRKERFAKHEFVFKGGYFGVPHYTASLDAAMTLVPEGWWLQYIGQVIGGWSCRVETNEALPSIGTGFPPKQPVATGPLALCTAALRARAAEQSALNREGGNG